MHFFSQVASPAGLIIEIDDLGVEWVEYGWYTVYETMDFEQATKVAVETPAAIHWLCDLEERLPFLSRVVSQTRLMNEDTFDRAVLHLGLAFTGEIRRTVLEGAAKI